MSAKRPPVLLVVILIAALLGAGYYTYTTYFRPAASTALTASGTVEATDITLAPELAGRVVEVLVQEGATVQAGDVLFRLDDTLLQSQRAVAAAALDTAQAAAFTADAAATAAQAQYDLVLYGALAEQKPGRNADWTAPQAAEFNQPAWYFGETEQLAAAQAEAAAAQTDLETAQAKVTTVEQKAASGEFVAAENQVVQARAAFLIAQSVLSGSVNANAELLAAAQSTFDQAASDLIQAQKDYTDTATTTGAQDVLTARAELQVAQERYDTAQDRVRGLQTGRLSPKVAAAHQSLEQAQAAAAQAKTAIAQAQANLALIDTQIAKLTVKAPADGVILTRAIEPGEVVMPGSALLTLARLSDLTMTVYVPEDRYGELALGQTATVSADSFPGKTFAATVIYISGRAEFTPRNVQTTAGRKTTVFAIRLSLAEAGGALKPGMPADVVFH